MAATLETGDCMHGKHTMLKTRTVLVARVKNAKQGTHGEFALLSRAGSLPNHLTQT